MGASADAGALTDAAGTAVLVDAVCCAEVMTARNNEPMHKKSATFRMISPPYSEMAVPYQPEPENPGTEPASNDYYQISVYQK